MVLEPQTRVLDGPSELGHYCLHPKMLLQNKDKIKKSTENYLNIFKDYPYIFNLGHGVLPETKPETIKYIIKIVRDKK